MIFVLNFFTGLVNNIIHEIGVSVLTKIFHGFVNIFLISYLIALVKDLFVNRCWRISIVTLSLFVSSLLCVVELFLLLDFNTIINPSIVLILLETNVQESKEFFQTYYEDFKWIILGVIFLISIVAYVRRVCFIGKVRKYLNTIYIKFIFFSILFLGLSAGGYRFMKDSAYGKEIISPHMKTMLPSQRLYYSWLITKNDLRQYDLISRRMEVSNIHVVSNCSKIKNCILIIGESLGRNHMSLYGYSLPTTPFCDSLFQRGELYRFNDVICPSLYTSASIQKIMSFFNNESKGKWYDYANIIDVMKAAGYKTYWISNQEMMGAYGNYVASLGNRCDDVYFNNKRNSIDERYGDFDGDLVSVLETKLSDGVDKKFIVLHFMGSHPLYRNRYPEAFDYFKAEDELIPYGKKSQKMAAQYDNTVLYNDHVIGEIIKVLKKTESVMIYLSDHGNEVYDNRDYTGRSENDISRYMVEIPFLVWESDRFKTLYPDKDSCIAKAVDKPYMADDLIHTVLGITGVQVAEYDSTRNIIHPSFNGTRLRVINGYDYDKDILN